MSDQYCLHVLRLDNLQWKFCLHSRTPDLYVVIRLGDVKRKTRQVKKTKSPIWNEILTFPLPDESRNFEISVLHDSIWSDPCIGVVDIEHADLLARSSNGEVTLDISSRNRTRRTVTGRLFLKLEVTNVSDAAEAAFREARKDVQQRGILRSAEASDLTQLIGDGAAQVSSQSNLLQAIGGLLGKLGAFKEVMDIVSELHPFIKVAWSFTSALYSAVQKTVEADQKVIQLVQKMDDAFEFIRDVQALRNKAGRLEKQIGRLLRQTIECCIFIRGYTSHCFIGRMSKADIEGIDAFQQSFTMLKSDIDSGVTHYTAAVSARVVEGIDRLLLHQDLLPDRFDAFRRPECQAQTRLHIRDQIIKWMFSESESEPNMFWLHGVAGSGKSTISTTIAKEFQDLRLGAFLFFERNKSDPSSVIRTIAYQLSLFDLSIALSLRSEIDRDKNFSTTGSAARQFNKLLLRPLQNAAKSVSGPILVVLDALDECGTAELRSELIELLQHEFPKLPKIFRFLITSRPESDIVTAFSPQSKTIRSVKLEHTSTEGQEDVLAYLRAEMRNIVGESLVRSTGSEWDEIITRLGRAADGLFIWASTVVRMVKKSNTKMTQLRKLAASTLLSGDLDELYASALSNSGIAWDEKESRELFVKVLALVLLSKVPVSSADIDGILGLSTGEDSDAILSNLQSVLAYSPGYPISLLHTSFSDYLMSPERSEEKWFINIPDAKSLIVHRCFIVMETLRFNICGLQSSFVHNDDVPGLADHVDQCIPSHLKYTCLHWAGHLIDVPYSPDLCDKLSDFAYKRLLFWFEVLSLIKVFDHVASRVLSEVSKWTELHGAAITSFLQDASKRATIFAGPIMESTPHIYVSMIPLSKGDSEVADHYSNYTTCMVRVEQKGAMRQAHCLKVIERHRGSVNSVAFSPVRRHVASVSDDKTVRVCDIDSGEEIFMSLNGHKGPVTSICFSPDGSRIVSGSADCALIVWDALKGNLILGPLKIHTKAVWSVAWSPDETKIASGSGDRSIILWDAVDGKPIFTLVGHKDRITSLAFSLDSLRIASGSWDETIRIWDVKSGSLTLGPFEVHSAVSSVSFCPDGRHLATTYRNAIQIREVSSGNVISTHEGHKSNVMPVVYSPCGTRIVSGSWDQSVIVWDAKSGDIISGSFEGHTGVVSSVVFSVDGKYIASGSWDSTVRIWDATSSSKSVSSDTSTRHTGPVRSVAYSPDGRRIASASWDGSVIIWDALTGAVILGPLLRTHPVICVLFFSDGSRFLSGSRDGTIRTWDVDSGKEVAVPLVDADEVSCIALSPDGKTAVCGSFDGMIRAWRVETGKLIAGPLSGLREWVSSAAFSPDGKRLVSVSSNSILLWDTETWESASLARDVVGGQSICFSRDGTRIASGSLGVITIWDAGTACKVAGPFRGHTDSVSSVVFSVDGSRVISASDDSTIQVWDVGTGMAVCVLEGHTGFVNSLALSPDGFRIVSGSYDDTIRVWDVSDLLQPSMQSSSDAMFKTASSLDDRDSSDWVLRRDGWILSRYDRHEIRSEGRSACDDDDAPASGQDQRNLLLWIPPDLRAMLWRPRNTGIFSCDFSTKLDFADAAIGERWVECFIAPIRR